MTIPEPQRGSVSWARDLHGETEVMTVADARAWVEAAVAEAEQRVTEGWYGVSNFTAGYNKGVQAARDAVAAFDVKSNDRHGPLMYVWDALAAIDALRGESNG